MQTISEPIRVGNYTISRDFTDEDYPRIAELISLGEYEPVQPETIRSRDIAARDRPWLRLVARDPMGKIIASGATASIAYEPAYRYWTGVVVDHPARSQGLGSKMLELLEEFMHAVGATRWRMGIREDQERTINSARKRGYGDDHLMRESVLELENFDPSRFGPLFDSLANQGIVIERYADYEDSEDTRRKLYEVSSVTEPDVPGAVSGHVWSFEEFCKEVLDRDGQILESFAIARKGDQFIGMTAMSRDSATMCLNDFTGVIPEFRGLGIALALKAFTVGICRDLGFQQMKTWNDYENKPMIAVNDKIGYVPRVGWLLLEKFVAPPLHSGGEGVGG